jgi:microcompartment protein CcmK/EutM
MNFELRTLYLVRFCRVFSKPKVQSTKYGFMFLGKVVGTVWSTKKSPDLEGVRFLIVHPYDLDHEPTKNVVVVADRLGAGTGETVMCAYGKAARTAIGNQDMSIEAAVVGIVDRVDLTDTKSEELREVARSLGRDNGGR